MARRFFLQSLLGALATRGRVGQTGATVHDADPTTGEGSAWEPSPPGPEGQSPPLVCALDDAPFSRARLSALKQAGIGCWLPCLTGIPSFAHAYNFLDRLRPHVGVARTVSDVRRIASEGATAACFGWRTLEPLLEGRGRATSPSGLRTFHELGLRIAGIANRDSNQFGGGVDDPDTGLTQAGVRILEEALQLGITLFVGGDTNDKTSLAAIRVAGNKPVVCIHPESSSGVAHAHGLRSPLTDAVVRNGGVIGLRAPAACHDAVSDGSHRRNGPPSSRYLEAYDALKRVVGVAHVAIIPPAPAEETAPTPTGDVSSDGSGAGHGAFGDLGCAIRGLVSLGWTKSEVEQSLGGNWIRVFQATWRG